MNQDKMTDEERIKLLPQVEDKDIYAKAYLSFLEDRDISLTAKFIWLHLRARRGINGYVWFGQKTVANTLNISDDTYRKYLSELENKAAIKQYKRYRKDTGAPTSNIIVCFNYDPFAQAFVIPDNILDIDNAILKLFGNDFNIKIKEISKLTPNPKKSGIPKPKISARVVPENLGLPLPENLSLPHPKISAALPENLGTNKSNSNKSNSNKSNLGIERNNNSPSFQDLNNINFVLKNLDVIEGVKNLPDISEVTYKTWLDVSLSNAYIENNEIILPCADEFMSTMLKNKYFDKVSKVYMQTPEFKNLGIKIIIKQDLLQIS